MNEFQNPGQHGLRAIFSTVKVLTYHVVTGREAAALDDAALPLAPGLAVRVGGTRVLIGWGVRTAARALPAVPEHHGADHQRPAPRGEVVVPVAVVVPAQPAQITLQKT